MTYATEALMVGGCNATDPFLVTELLPQLGVYAQREA